MLEAAFRSLDLDGDGYLDYYELRMIIGGNEHALKTAKGS